MIGTMKFECAILWLVLLLYKGGAQTQLSVTLSSQSICAVTGSTVDIPCKYTKPYSFSVIEREWYQVQRSNGEPRDMTKVPQYSRRVSVSTGWNDCTLTMINVKVSDFGDYNFRFRTGSSEWTSAPSGTTLTVTDLQLKVDLETLGQRKVKVTCSSTCSFSKITQYYWFRNGKFMYRSDASIEVDSSSVNDEDSYSCRVSGSSQRSPAMYPPRNTRAVMVPSGGRVEGDSVTLTCSSDANPPVLTYSWFKQRAVADRLLKTHQNYSITKISSQHSGLYYCTAHNQLGQQNSTPTLLDMLYPPRVPSVTTHESGGSVTLQCYSDSNPTSTYSWYKKTGNSTILFGNGTNLTLATRTSRPFFCVAKNRVGSSKSAEWPFSSGIPAGTYVASGVTVGLFLTLMAVFLWMSRGRTEAVSSRREVTSAKHDSAPAYDNISAMTSDPTQTASSAEQEDIHYASINFTCSQTQEVPVIN